MPSLPLKELCNLLATRWKCLAHAETDSSRLVSDSMHIKVLFIFLIVQALSRRKLLISAETWSTLPCSFSCFSAIQRPMGSTVLQATAIFSILIIRRRGELTLLIYLLPDIAQSISRYTEIWSWTMKAIYRLSYISPVVVLRYSRSPYLWMGMYRIWWSNSLGKKTLEETKNRNYLVYTEDIEELCGF